MKIAWCITGAEMFLKEVIEIISNLGPEKVDIFLSKSGKAILKSYNLLSQIAHFKIYEDTEENLFRVRSLFSGKYDILMIAPCSTNTVAKMSLGISDNLITNLFSQAGKLRLPIYVLPSDTQDIIEFSTRTGKNHIIYMREIDKENLKRLSKFEGVRILHSLQEIKHILIELLP